MIFETRSAEKKVRPSQASWINWVIRNYDFNTGILIRRGSRSVLDLQLIVKGLEKKGVTFAATEQSINTKTLEGKCFLNMLSVFSEFETCIRSERQKDGIKANIHKFKSRAQTIDAKKIQTLKDEGMGAMALAKEMGIDRTSVYRLLKKVSK